MPRLWDRRLYLFAIGIYIVIAISSLFSGVTSWDEETDYLGIRTQIEHGLRFLRGENPDYKLIHSNLEYYGTVGLLAPWFLWFLQQSALVGRMTISQALFSPSAEHQLTGFFLNSHLYLAFEFVVLSWLVVLIARRLNASFPWLAGCLTLLIPSLLGHSFVNPKDIPFALFYTFYTYTLIVRHRSGEDRFFWLSVLSAGLLINQKFVAAAPVLLSEGLLFFLQPRSLRSFIRSSTVPVFGLFLALTLQPASWGLLPWSYLHEAFETFAKHEWGGCMWWGGTCVGINQPDWSTLVYLWRWWSIKWPTLIIVLVLAQLYWLVLRISRRQLPNFWPSPWLLLLSQAFLVPFMAVLRQSNLYDADRHTLFVYPVLAVISCFGFQRIYYWRGSLFARKLLISFICILGSIMLLDDLLIHPYQSAYLNEWGRIWHNHTTTALDYWAVSAKESLRQAQLNEKLSLSPTVDDSLGPLPLFIGHRQLSGHVEKHSSPKLIFQVRGAPAFKNLQGCTKASEVSRTLSTGQDLLMSRLWTCP